MAEFSAPDAAKERELNYCSGDKRDRERERERGRERESMRYESYIRDYNSKTGMPTESSTLHFT